jgi:hypothetical protein
MKKPILIAISLGLALAVGGAWQAHRVKRERQQVLAAAVQQRAALTEKIRGVEGRIATAERQRAESQATLDGLRAAPAAVPAPAATMPRTDELLARDPTLRALYWAAKRADQTVRYGPLVSALHLTPEQTAKFTDLMIKREEQRQDMLGALNTLQDPNNMPSAAKLLGQAAEEFKAAQITLLGMEGYAQLDQYERSLAVRFTIVDSLGEELARTNTPLTGQQAERLTQVLANASSEYRKGGSATQDTLDWAAVLAQAPGLLSAEQLDAFKATAASQQITSRTFGALRTAGVLR